MKVKIQPIGKGIVDDGQGFPGASPVSDYYCPICAHRGVPSDGEDWCEHKEAVRDALQAELDEAPLPFDDESESYVRRLQIAIGNLEEVERGER